MIGCGPRLRLAVLGLALVGFACRARGQVDDVGGDLNPFRACGLNCLYVIAKYYGHPGSLESLRSILRPSEEGESSVADLERAASAVGLFPVAVKADMATLPELPLPAIVHLRSRSSQSAASHYVVLLALHRRGVMTIDAPTGTTIHPYDETVHPERLFFRAEDFEALGKIRGKALARSASGDRRFSVVEKPSFLDVELSKADGGGPTTLLVARVTSPPSDEADPRIILEDSTGKRVTIPILIGLGR